MAIPTNPTASSIVTEAYNKVGIDSPTSAQVTRGTDHFLEEIKNDIWSRAGRMGNTRLKTLQTYGLISTFKGQSKYALPSDFDEEISISLLDGLKDVLTVYPTPSSLQDNYFASMNSWEFTDTDLVGNYVFFLNPTTIAAVALQQIRKFVEDQPETGLVTIYVDETIEGTVSASDRYVIMDEVTEIEEDNVLSMGGVGANALTIGIPTTFMKLNEGVTEYIIFDKACDYNRHGRTYAEDNTVEYPMCILVRYYANLGKLDLVESGSALIDKIYLNWHETLKTGVAWKVAEYQDDDRGGPLRGRYKTLVNNLLDKEIPFGGEFEGFQL